MIRKNFKLTFCVVLGVLAVLCMGMFFGMISVRAESQKSVSIKYCNLAFQDNVYILYAVDSENIVNRQDIKVLVWRSAQDEYVYGSQDAVLNYFSDEVIGGKTYSMFVYNKLSAKEMTDDVYACPYYNDGNVEIYGKMLKYSILQYAYNKMNSSTTADELKNLLSGMLSYGGLSQNYFDYKTSTLANDTYYKITVNNGTLEDGFTTGLVKENSEVTLIANEPVGNEPFSYWRTESGKKIAGNTVIVTKNETYTAVYGESSADLDLEQEFTNDGQFTVANSNMPFSSTSVDYVDATEEGLIGATGAVLKLGVFANNGAGVNVDFSASKILVGSVQSIIVRAYVPNGTTSNIVFRSYNGVWDQSMESYDMSSWVDIPLSATTINSFLKDANGYLSSVWIGGRAHNSNTTVMYIDSITVNYKQPTVNYSQVGVYGWNNMESGGAYCTIVQFSANFGASANGTNLASTSNATSLGVKYNGKSFYELYKTNNLYALSYAHGNAYFYFTIPKADLVASNGYSVPTLEIASGTEFYNQILPFVELECVGNSWGLPLSYEPKFIRINQNQVDAGTLEVSSIIFNTRAFVVPSNTGSRNIEADNGGFTINGEPISDIRVVGTGEVWFVMPKAKEVAGYNNYSHATMHIKEGATLVNNGKTFTFPEMTMYLNYTTGKWQTTKPDGYSKPNTGLILELTNDGLFEILPNDYNNSYSDIIEYQAVSNLTYIDARDEGLNGATGAVLKVTNNLSFKFFTIDANKANIFAANVESVVIRLWLKNGNYSGTFGDLFMATKWDNELYSDIDITQGFTDVTLKPETIEAWTKTDGKLGNLCVMPSGSGDKELYIDSITINLKSLGLEYVLLGNNTYGVKGIGTCTDSVLYIPSTYNGLPVSKVLEGAFYNNSSITKVVIPSSIKDIGEGAFSVCSSLTEFVVDENNNYFKAIDGNLYSKDGTVLLQYAIGKADTNFNVPNSVTRINGGAFAMATNLNSVDISTKVASIGGLAFYGCSFLVTENNISYVDGWAVASNPSIVNAVIKSGTVGISDYLFKNCIYLTSVTIPNTVKRLGNSAFYGCIGLTSIIIPNSVKNIGEGAFYMCTSLKTVSLPNSIISIGEGAFYMCTSLTSVTIPSSVITIGDFAFDSCSSLLSIAIPNSVISIGTGVFQDCTALMSVTLSDALTFIGRQAFYNCSALTEILIPTSVEYFGVYAFGECTSLIAFGYNGTSEEWENITKASTWKDGVSDSCVVYASDLYFYI